MNATLLVIPWLLAAAPESVWPAFNGAGASPIDPASVPVKWSPTENVAWKTKLPADGQSSPVVWGDKVFVTYIEGPNKETSHVTALNLGDGKILWDHSSISPQTAPSNYYNSRSAPTPAVDAERVYAFFETGVVAAVDHAGREIWSRNLVKDYGEFKNEFGLASSPLLVDDALVLLIDHEGPSYLLALDRKSGETKWKTDRTSRKAYSSPILVTVGDSKQIVCSADGSVDGYDVKSGERLWTVGDVGGNTTCSPYPFGDGKFLVGASLGREANSAPAARKSNMAMQIKRTESGYSAETLWRTEQAQPTFASPMVHNGKAYWVNRSGVVFCFDVQTGEQLYSGRIKQACWATPIGVGDRIYCFGKDGLTSVISNGPTLEILAENQLWNPDETPADTFGAPRPRGGEGNGENRGGGPGGNRAGTAPSSAPTPAPTTGTPAKPTSYQPPATQPGSAPNASGERPTGAQGESRGAGGPGAGGLPPDGAGRFPDPIQYGAAIVNGGIVVRTGGTIYCIRSTTP